MYRAGVYGFYDHQLEIKAGLFRVFLFVTAGLTLVFAFWDRLIDPLQAAETLGWRTAGSAWLALLGWRLKAAEKCWQHDFRVWTLATLYAAFLCLVFSRLQDGLLLGLPSFCLLLIVASLLLVRSHLVPTLSSILLVSWVVSWAAGLPSRTVLSHQVMMLTALSLVWLLAFLSEVAAQKQFALRQEMTRLASLDPLTGCLNRRAGSALLEKESQRSRRYSRPLSQILLDIDHFKLINDRYGHARGDQVLRHLAQLCRDQLRASDGLIRWGGEEFLVILPETSLPEAGQLAERLRSAVAEHPLGAPGGLQMAVTVSLGYAEAGPEESWEATLARADEALYQAKEAGRNCSRAASQQQG